MTKPTVRLALLFLVLIIPACSSAGPAPCFSSGDCATNETCADRGTIGECVEKTGAAPSALGGASITPVTSCTLPGKTSWVDDHHAVGATISTQFVEVISPPVGTTVSPVGVIVIHGGSYTGGGWTAGSGSPAGATVAQDARAEVFPFATAGFTSFMVSYRLATANRSPMQVSDVQCGARWVAANASTYGVDPARLVLLGDSVGGQLALSAALGLGSDDGSCNDYPATGMPGVKALVGISALEDLTDTGGAVPTAAANLFASPTGALELAASPLTYAAGADGGLVPALNSSASLPPLLLLHWTGDTIVPVAQARAMKTAAQAGGYLATLIETAGAFHDPNPFSFLSPPTPGCTLMAFLAAQ